MKNILSFDVETLGLYGTAFAVGAVVLEEIIVVSKFAGQVKIPAEKTRGWLEENVLPKIMELPVYDTDLQLRNVFWNWLQKEKNGVLVVADFGCPAEAGFIRDMVKDDEENRQWQGPYPLHEVGTLLLAAGDDPDVDREHYVAKEISMLHKGDNQKHNPLWDAWVSALCARKALMKLERLEKKTARWVREEKNVVTSPYKMGSARRMGWVLVVGEKKITDDEEAKRLGLELYQMGLLETAPPKVTTNPKGRYWDGILKRLGDEM